MTNKYAGTQTEKNLQEAFAGESQARNKYTYFASVAKKEGYEQMSALFLKTADNEKEHAKMWFKELAGIGDTKANLAAAAKVKTTNGLTCTKALPKLQKRKVSRSWLPSSEPLVRLKNTTKKDTAHCSTTLKQHRYSKRVRSRFGNAEIAVIS